MRQQNQQYNNHIGVSYYDILRKVSPDVWSIIYTEYREEASTVKESGDTDRHLLDFFRANQTVQKTFCAIIKNKKISPSVFSFIGGIEASIPYGLTENQCKSIITTFSNVMNREVRSN